MADWQRQSIFCEECGNLLRLNSWQKVHVCELCEAKIPVDKLKIASVPTRKEFNQKKEWLENYAESQGEPTEDGKMKTKVKISSQPQSTRATIERECPNEGCDGKVMYYYTMQLRSVDEGQTVFYECAKCGYTFSLNT